MIIKETPGSPFVQLSVDDCIFEIKGNSFSENINEVYEKVLTWIDEEIPKAECEINFTLRFNVLNSVTYKNILIMMTKFAEFQKQGKKINIIWYFDKDDEDSLAIGEDIEELFNLPVQFKENN